LAAGAVLVANPAKAAVFTVTNTNDSGAGSLRQAVIDASATSSPDGILFDPTVFSSAQTISLLSEILIPATSGPLTIQGPGASLLTITRDPSASDRLIDTNASLTISGVTMKNGAPNGNSTGGEQGGAVDAEPGVTLTIVDSVLTGNSAVYGGAINGFDAFVHLVRCTLSGNAASGAGGGLNSGGKGSFLIEDSTISGNSAGTPPTFGGGGIFFQGTVATSPPAGFTPGALVIRNSTISSNTSPLSGGGVLLGTLDLPVSGSLLVQDSTITGNTCGGIGGGVAAQFSSPSAITLANSIVSGNLGGNLGCTYDLSSYPATQVTANGSAIGDTNYYVSFSPTSGNNLAPGTNLILGPLADNGGPTLTQAPLAGSPLINAGSTALVPAGLTTDQRGAARVSGPAVDIGAVEVQPRVAVPASDAKHLAILAAALAGAALARLRKSRVTGSG
jgi:hypothetical protein